MKQRYSFWQLARRAWFGAAPWQSAWRRATPASSYDVIIVGGGGHGLATAYYLASRHGIRRIAVLERGWLGGGNTGRNTQAVRSNYFHAASARFYEHSLRLYESLGRELNYNVMLGQRGVITLAHDEHQLDAVRSWCNAVQLHGIDAEMLSTADLTRHVPALNQRGRIPVVGGFVQWRAGMARHDSVTWGYARACSSLGVDLVEGCEVRSLVLEGDRIIAVDTSLGRLHAPKIALATAGQTTRLMAGVGVGVPITCATLQAMVTEPVKPVLDVLIHAPSQHVYLNQTDHGEVVIGGSTDGYNSFSQRGGLRVLQANAAAATDLFPVLGQLKILRQWAGVVDITADSTPIVGKTPVRGLYVSAGWGTGGFKAIPGGGDTFAHTIAHDSPHPLIAAFDLARFDRGALIDEAAAAGVAH